MQDFTASFFVSKTPTQVFEAVLNVRGWWSRDLEGSSAKEGDEFVYRHKELHYSRHRVTEIIPNQKVSWLTLDGSINFVADTTEWNGTLITFEVEDNDGQTLLKFSHLGLNPSLQCFEGCSGGWQHYLNSLQELIETGKGNPD